MTELSTEAPNVSDANEERGNSEGRTLPRLSLDQLMAAAALMLAFTCARADVDLRGCDADTALLVEEQIVRIANWRDFSRFYRQYGRCDRPALGYAFTDQIASLAEQQGGVPDLHREIARHPALRQVTLRHLRSDAVTTEQAGRIRTAIKSDCPVDARRLCRELLAALNGEPK